MIVRTFVKHLNLIHGNPNARFSLLKDKLKEIIPVKQQEFKKLKEQFGKEEADDLSVDDTLDGLKGVKGLYWECSTVDPDEGVKFRGYSIPDVMERLQKAPEGKEPLPEAMLWLLLTGEIPKEHQVKDLTDELHERTEIPGNVEKYISDLSPDLHPMAQLSIALLCLQPNSQFKKAYNEGVQKQKYWNSTYDDVIDIIAKLPRIAALIYRNTYKNKKIINVNKKLDWGGNFAHMMGFERFEFQEAMRSYLTLHSDHGSGNVSEHATHVVGSALSDPYLAYSAGINSLFGPLHGLDNKRVLKWVLKLNDELGENAKDDQIKDFVLKELAQGSEIPGYGHTILRESDPRLDHFQKFADEYLEKDPLYRVSKSLFRIVPSVLGDFKKVKNPIANIDALSGIIFHSYGLRETDFYPVIFAVSRSLGSLSGLVWSRALSLPIERSLSTEQKWVKENTKEQGRGSDINYQT